CRLWVEGKVRTLTVERSITGPIRTRGNGQVEALTVTDSILQAVPTAAGWPVEHHHVKDLVALVERLLFAGGDLAAHLRELAPARSDRLARLEAGGAAGPAEAPARRAAGAGQRAAGGAIDLGPVGVPRRAAVGGDAAAAGPPGRPVGTAAEPPAPRGRPAARP